MPLISDKKRKRRDNKNSDDNDKVEFPNRNEGQFLAIVETKLGNARPSCESVVDKDCDFSGVRV